jgi:hypothetical protein
MSEERADEDFIAEGRTDQTLVQIGEGDSSGRSVSSEEQSDGLIEIGPVYRCNNCHSRTRKLFHRVWIAIGVISLVPLFILSLHGWISLWIMFSLGIRFYRVFQVLCVHNGKVLGPVPFLFSNRNFKVLSEKFPGSFWVDDEGERKVLKVRSRVVIRIEPVDDRFAATITQGDDLYELSGVLYADPAFSPEQALATYADMLYI